MASDAQVVMCNTLNLCFVSGSTGAKQLLLVQGCSTGGAQEGSIPPC